jgi:hypothetical protein
MRQTLLSALLIAVVFTTSAKTTQSTHLASAGVFNDSTSSVNLPAAREMLAEIMNIVGLTPNFELKEAKVNNVEASISHRKRYILYNPEFINWITKVTKDKWAAVALLAHEVGHHLNGHTIKRSGSKPKLELEADEFAGFVLFKMGATLEQSQEVMKYIAQTKASKTHPARNSRMLAIQKGWNKAAHPGETTLTAQK